MNNKLQSGFLVFSLLCVTVIFGFALLTTDFSVRRTQKIEASISKVETDASRFHKLPLSFEPNYGQTDSEVKFLSRGDGYTLFLTAEEAVLRLKNSDAKAPSAVLRLGLEGANQTPEIIGQNRLAGKSNYFIGDKQNNWHTDVPTFGRVQYKDVYKGIDQIFYGNGRQLEYDFIVAPNADPKQIALKFDGADTINIANDGDLVLKFRESELRQQKPIVYQHVDDVKREVVANYTIENGKVGFVIGEYDCSKPLVIDPILVYSTYLGGNGADAGHGITLDSEGSVYVTGSTASTDFPTLNPVQANLNGTRSDVFVTKINAAGNAIVYSTYIGGNVGDGGYGIDVDNAGNAYVTGTTGGTTDANDFPTTENAFDRNFTAPDESFLFKLNQSGNALVYSTYTGGSIGAEVKVNRATGEAFIAGNAGARLPTTPGAFRTACQPTPCSSSSFVTKFNAEGSALVYSTYIGPGPANDLAIDAEGNAYITGSTISNAFPITPGAAQPTCVGCNNFRSDAFVTKLNATGSALIYSTYLGGSVDEVGSSIAVDAAQNAYVTGRTESSSGVSVPFPTTAGAFQTTSQGIPDAFVTKVNPTGTAFVYSTYFGGDVRDEAFGIAVDRAGNAHLTGQTGSRNFPLIEPFQSSCTVNGSCVFISTLNSTGSALAFSTFFGQGQGLELVADARNNIYITGQAFPGLTNIPTMNAIQPNPSSNPSTDGFVAKIQLAQPTAASVTISGRVVWKNRGIPRARVFLTDANGEVRIAVTNPSGYYRFTDVQVGETYVLRASGKRYSFAPQVLMVMEEINDLNFVARR